MTVIKWLLVILLLFIYKVLFGQPREITNNIVLTKVVPVKDMRGKEVSIKSSFHC